MKKLKKITAAMLSAITAFGALAALPVSVSASEKSYSDLYADFLQNVHDNPEDYVHTVKYLGTVEEDEFAVEDINGDGVEDLIILFHDGSHDEQYAGVWTVDTSTNTVVKYGELGVLSEFYGSGIVKDNYLHNQGPGDDIWPYALCRYDESQQKYVYFASAVCYEEKLDASGSFYKEEYDADNDGVVYVWEDKESGDTEYLTLAQYNARVEKYTPESSKIDLATYKLTEENIAMLRGVAANGTLGNVNGDNNIDISDVTDIQKSIAQITAFTSAQKKAADVNGDGGVDINDATLVQKYIARIITAFPADK